MSQLSRNINLFGQDFADFEQRIRVAFCAAKQKCNLNSDVHGVPRHGLNDSFYCYPSPDRFVRYSRTPVAFSRLVAGHCLREPWGLAFHSDFAGSVRTITPNKGRKSCLKLLISSLQQLCFPSLLASKTMLSVRLLARASAASLAKQSAITTAPKAHLLAASSAHLPTTSNTTCRKAIEIIETAAAGQPCARRFCF